MKEVYHISGSGNNSGLSIYESSDDHFIIKIPKTLVSKSWRYLLIGISLLFLSIAVPMLYFHLVDHFLLKIAFLATSMGCLVLGSGLAIIATWEIRSTIDLTLTDDDFTVFQPAFFKYRSLTRTYKKIDLKKLYVTKVKIIGKEKYSLMLESSDPLDERLVKGFYVPDQALWIAEKINKRL